MDNFEGSVDVDGIDVDETISAAEESTPESINNQDESKDSETGEEVAPAEDSAEESRITDKGTKLDPNPESAVHQELANYKREVEEYRQFMTDPKALSSYIKDLEEQTAQATGQTAGEVREQAEEEFVTDPNKIETAEDLRSYTKYLTKTVDDAKNSLNAELARTKTEQREAATANSIIGEITQMQNKYSALRPFNSDGTPNPEFDKVLENEIGDLYESIDFDKRTGKYMGKISIAKIADSFMKIHKVGESAGSKAAQTVVLDKRSGAVKTSGGGNSSPDESKMSASQMIASRMAKARGNR